MEKQKILIVDDEKEITDLVEIYLTSEGYEVFKFYCGKDALECLENEKIDLAILDVMLPDIDGFAICRRIREKYFFPIIMLTAKIEENDKINGILIGADDYITKPFQPLELIARVKGQLRRAGQYNQAAAQRESYYVRGLELDATAHKCSLYGKELSLTPTEFDIILYLCRHMGQVVKSEELFEHIWKEKYYDGSNTVFLHISRIREKMHDDSRNPKFIKTVWGIGYKLEE